jgi:hypothetical protein
MTDRQSLPSPGPSYLRELPLHPGDDRLVGMSAPQTLEEWWIAMLWCERDHGLLDFSDLAPSYGIPPGSPLLRLGPGISGSLSGLILEENGRQQLRLRLGQPPQNEDDPWHAPLVVILGLRFEPAKLLTMRENEIAHEVLVAFREAVLRLSY